MRASSRSCELRTVVAPLEFKNPHSHFYASFAVELYLYLAINKDAC